MDINSYSLVDKTVNHDYITQQEEFDCALNKDKSSTFSNELRNKIESNQDIIALDLYNSGHPIFECMIDFAASHKCWKLVKQALDDKLNCLTENTLKYALEASKEDIVEAYIGNSHGIINTDLVKLSIKMGIYTSLTDLLITRRYPDLILAGTDRMIIGNPYPGKINVDVIDIFEYAFDNQVHEDFMGLLCEDAIDIFIEKQNKQIVEYLKQYFYIKN